MRPAIALIRPPGETHPIAQSHLPSPGWDSSDPRIGLTVLWTGFIRWRDRTHRLPGWDSSDPGMGLTLLWLGCIRSGNRIHPIRGSRECDRASHSRVQRYGIVTTFAACVPYPTA